ncbi:hypothetical protein XENOCAPTIV_004568, partial [Xenoophorus captivus]
LNSKERLAAEWARYLFHVLSGPSELHYILRSVRTIDLTKVDPLLLLKAALILQACQRCPLVLAGCVLFRGSSHSTQEKDAPPKKTRLSRTLSDTPSSESEPSHPTSCQSPQKLSFNPHLSGSEDSVFSPAPSQSTADSPNPFPVSPVRPFSNGGNSHETVEKALDESHYHSFHSSEDEVSQMHNEADGSVFEENLYLNGGALGGDATRETSFEVRGADCGNDLLRDDRMAAGDVEVSCSKAGGHKAETKRPPPVSCAFDSLEESPLIPMMLYMHRVSSLVLALLVEPRFMSDTASMEEVVRKLILICRQHYLIPLSSFDHPNIKLTLFLWLVSRITAAWLHSMDLRPISGLSPQQPQMLQALTYLPIMTLSRAL